MTLTPVQKVGNVWVKRDDLFEVAGASGGKARSCLALAKTAKEGLVTAGSRHSPQVVIVARIGAAMGLPVRVHVPAGADTPETAMAEESGAEVIRHRAGYNSVICARAREDAAGRAWRLIPFGMECWTALEETAAQVSNLPHDAWRVVVPVGSGMSLAGILEGLSRWRNPARVIGVTVGADPRRRLDRYFPDWKRRCVLLASETPYSTRVDADLEGIALDPIYEAKCIPFLRPGDCFWIVGLRPTNGGAG